MHSRADTAEAEPPDEPPGTSDVLEPSRRQGLTTGPKHEVSFDEPIANSSLLSLPSITAPSRQSCDVTVDSYVGTKLPRIFEHAVVRTSLVANRSLIPSGMPASGPPSPLAILASTARAMSRARSGVSITKTLSARAASIASRCASVSSSDVKDLFARPALASARVNDVKSVIYRPDCRRTATAFCRWPGRRFFGRPCRRLRADRARRPSPCRDRRPCPDAPSRRDSSCRPHRPFHRRRADTSDFPFDRNNLLNDLGHQKEVIFRGRRIPDHVVRDLAVIDHVRALFHFHWHHRGHRFDAIDVHFAELFDKGQHRIQLALQMRNFSVSDRDPRKMRNTANGGGIDGHYIGPLNSEFSPPYSRGCFCTATAAVAPMC